MESEHHIAPVTPQIERAHMQSQDRRWPDAEARQRVALATTRKESKPRPQIDGALIILALVALVLVALGFVAGVGACKAGGW